MEKDFNSFTPCNIYDWRTLLIDILDGKYDLDIRKIGSSTSFIKNRLGLCEDRNRQHDNLNSAMHDILLETNFDFIMVLDEPPKYRILLQWVGDFLGYNSEIVKKILYFFIKLNTSKVNLKTDEGKEISECCAQVFFRILKSCKSPYLGNYNNSFSLLYESKEFEKILISWISEDDEANILYGCLIIIYLQKWTNLNLALRYEVIEKIASNSCYIRNVFMEILDDMEVTEVGEKIDYIYFLDDVRKMSSELYDYIDKHAQHWVSPIDQLNPIGVKEQLRERLGTINQKSSEIDVLINKIKVTLYKVPNDIN